MFESDKSRLSTYNIIKTLRKTENSTVELVNSSLDGKTYIKKSYPADKRAVFKALSKINDPHIPKVREIFFTEDTIVIEDHIEGETLDKYIEGNRRFSRQELERIISGLLDAVDKLHKARIIHRDIKPGNIIIDNNGEAVLIDYNIARTYSLRRNEDTELLGTVGYAAPEQFGFSQSDYRTDIYALGVTLKQILNEENSTPRIRRIIERCTEFDPAKRFQGISDIRKALKPKFTKPLLISCIASALALALVFVMPMMRAEQKKSSPEIERVLERQVFYFKDSMPSLYTDMLNGIDGSAAYSGDWQYDKLLTADNFDNITWNIDQIENYSMVTFRGESKHMQKKRTVEVSFYILDDETYPIACEGVFESLDAISTVTPEGFTEQGMSEELALASTDAAISCMLLTMVPNALN